ncbi:MAG: cytochrome c oxidase subunit II [Chloroflexi bacterium]|nr:MAG: cytochrome c oxidase subunit II [Chloroflexota bacterium]
MKHLVTVVVLIVAVTVIVGVFFSNIDLTPIAASAEATPIDWLFNLHMQVIAFLFAMIMVFVLYSVFAFRRKPGDDSDGDYFHGHTTLEIVWTIVPLVIVLYFSYLGAVTLADITTPGDNEMVVEVTAQQWSWRFDYPEAGLTTTELNLPLGRTVLLKMTSNDVLHDFWVPEFRVKQDTVPGMTKELRITPTELGTYKVRCAELCGTDHAYMLANVNVMTSDGFEEWLAGEQEALAAAESGPAAERGAKLAEVNGCTACHTIDGSPGVGPTWLNMYEEDIPLADGSTVKADEEYLRESIVDPGAKIVDGFNNIMPPKFGETLSAEEIDALIAYMESLGE